MIPMLESELSKLQDAKENIAKTATQHMSPAVHTMARQCFDHLDAAALFLQQLDYYIVHQPAAAEKAANEAVAKGDVVSGPQA
jgi:3-oxoacyl-[acyl-carrier-protein] synthase III